MERERVERAVDALLAASGSPQDRAVFVRVLWERAAAIRGDEERLRRTHSLVRLLLESVPVVAWVRHRSLRRLRESDPTAWTHGETASKLGIERASAASIAHGPRRPPEGAEVPDEPELGSER